MMSISLDFCQRAMYCKCGLTLFIVLSNMSKINLNNKLPCTLGPEHLANLTSFISENNIFSRVKKQIYVQLVKRHLMVW